MINIMENEDEIEKSNFFDKILAKKGLILIFIGIAIRILMLIYYYYSHMTDPQRGWGDVGLNFKKGWSGYSPLTLFLLYIFITLSFESIYIFAFWAFFWDFLTSFMVYFVIKNFNIKNKNYVFGLFLINPFWFLNNSFSIVNCGYHITDAFFFFFLFMALIYLPKKELYAKYLFYIFLGLSICTKYYTLPAIGFFILKFLYDKDWKELKIFILCVVPTLVILLLLPLIFLEGYLESLIWWHGPGSVIPIYIRLIPILSITLLFVIFRLKKSDSLELTIVSIIALASFLIFSWPYLRWFQAIIFLGILKEREFFVLNLKPIKRQIKIDNHLITFILSIFGVILSYIIIIFIY